MTRRLHPLIVSFAAALATTWLARGLTDEERLKFYSAPPDKWSEVDKLDPLPGWSYEAMVRGLQQYLEPRNKVENLRVRLLAWKIEEDRRPLLIDSAILWASFDSQDGKRWVLSHCFRHPREYPDLWADSTPMDVRYSETLVLTRPPTNADVYGLVSHSQYWGPSDPEYTVHSARVRDKTWLRVIHESPTRSFK